MIASNRQRQELNTAKKILKARGWSYRTVAPRLGVTYQHLCLVLTGVRESRRLLKAIEHVPARNLEPATR